MPPAGIPKHDRSIQEAEASRYLEFRNHGPPPQKKRVVNAKTVKLPP
jgi:hypothetical protein